MTRFQLGKVKLYGGNAEIRLRLPPLTEGDGINHLDKSVWLHPGSIEIKMSIKDQRSQAIGRPRDSPSRNPRAYSKDLPTFFSLEIIKLQTTGSHQQQRDGIAPGSARRGRGPAGHLWCASGNKGPPSGCHCDQTTRSHPGVSHPGRPEGPLVRSSGPRQGQMQLAGAPHPRGSPAARQSSRHPKGTEKQR